MSKILCLPLWVLCCGVDRPADTTIANSSADQQRVKQNRIEPNANVCKIARSKPRKASPSPYDRPRRPDDAGDRRANTPARRVMPLTARTRVLKVITQACSSSSGGHCDKEVIDDGNCKDFAWQARPFRQTRASRSIPASINPASI